MATVNVSTKVMQAFIDEDNEQWEVIELSIYQYLSLSINLREPCRDSLMPGSRWVHELLNGNTERIYDEFRMERHVFINLCTMMQRRGWLSDSRYLKVDEQIGIFLQVLQGKGGVRRICERFQRSAETVSRFFRIVLQAFMKLGKENIRPPNFDVAPEEIRINPKHYPYFKDCVGAIDGTHVAATVPKGDQKRYYNRKGTTTQNVMCACSFDMKFTFVYCGWEGSANDCRIFHEALRDQSLLFPRPPIGKYYVVDSGYPTLRGFMTPFKGDRYHLQDYRGPRGTPRTPKELFNHRHSSLRNVIERTFGVLKARFPILKSMPAYPIKIQAFIVLGCCAVHNFIKDEQEADKWFNGLRRYDVLDADENDISMNLGGLSTDVADSGFQYGTAAEMNALKKSIANQLARRYRMPEIP